jgi:hypothetical protein
MADFLFTPAVLLLLRLQKYNKIGELQNSPPTFLLFFVLLFKHVNPFPESAHTIPTEFLQTSHGFYNGALGAWMCF